MSAHYKLTRNHAASSHGIPVLVDLYGKAYGPADEVVADDGRRMSARDFVRASQQGRVELDLSELEEFDPVELLGDWADKACDQFCGEVIPRPSRFPSAPAPAPVPPAEAVEFRFSENTLEAHSHRLGYIGRATPMVVDSLAQLADFPRLAYQGGQVVRVPVRQEDQHLPGTLVWVGYCHAFGYFVADNVQQATDFLRQIGAAK